MVVSCSTCHGAFEDKYLTCPRCAERKSRAAYLQLQRNYAEDIRMNRIPLLLGFVTGAQHIQLIGEPTHAFCGIRFYFNKRLPFDYEQLPTVEKLCRDCAAQLSGIVREVAA